MRGGEDVEVPETAESSEQISGSVILGCEVPNF